ncbi:hypothetical protein KM043_016988 [Ampulex compressa]|nr:hypothetical protein KM043_016988 [Ampulex compressa]
MEQCTYGSWPPPRLLHACFLASEAIGAPWLFEITMTIAAQLVYAHGEMQLMRTAESRVRERREEKAWRKAEARKGRGNPLSTVNGQGKQVGKGQ